MIENRYQNCLPFPLQNNNIDSIYQKSPRHFQDCSHIKLTYVTHFYCDQDNIDSVISLLREYESYDPNLLDIVMFVIVDDGSPIAYEIPKFNLNLRWIKINENIPWNQSGARNLGVTYAKSDNIVMTDLDHKIYENTLWYMANHKPCGRNFYKIKYVDSNKGHSNTFFMSRARFMRFFGYDEEFSGHYGAEDFRFVKFHKAHGSRQMYLPDKYRVERNRKEINRETSYHSLVRDLTHCTPVDLRKKLENRYFGNEQGHSRIFLNFTWRFLSEQRRNNIPQPKPKKWWYYLWYWRWLVGYK
ncbi:glycosyltransferase family A protein [Helicobacter pullorum]|uniref:glycosyltransferase family A protein n=1 Tax=Helicobacter pullorum TaxID=35818 RepID=UPI00019780F8|nr:glycosyltransferase family A protein [Helicobacter pullorum]